MVKRSLILGLFVINFTHVHASVKLQNSLTSLKGKLKDLSGALVKVKSKANAPEDKADVYITLVEFQITDLKFKNPKQAAIVNAANDGLQAGGGVCGAIFGAADREAGGEDKMQEECDAFNTSPKCPTGQARLTGSYGIRLGFTKPEEKTIKPDNLGAHYVIHAVGPTTENDAQLKGAYQESLKVADDQNNPVFKSPLITQAIPNITQIAFPSISTNLFGFALNKATPIGIDAIIDYVINNNTRVQEIYLVVFPLQWIYQDPKTKKYASDFSSEDEKENIKQKEEFETLKANEQLIKKYAYDIYKEALEARVTSGKLAQDTALPWDPRRKKSYDDTIGEGKKPLRFKIIK